MVKLHSYSITPSVFLGDVAYQAKSNVRTLIPHPPLLITSVYNSLLSIAKAKGQGAAKHRQAIVEKLLVAAKGEETRFLVRTLSQNLRVGAVRTSILTALARAMVLTPPEKAARSVSSQSLFHASADVLSKIEPLSTESKKKSTSKLREELTQRFDRAEALVKKIYVQHPNYDHIVGALQEVGLDGLVGQLPLTLGKQIRLKSPFTNFIMLKLPGIPLLPTLGSPTRSLDEIYDRLGLLPFTAEFKYDGQRAQIHARREHGQTTIKLFSRHLEDMTDKVCVSRTLFSHPLIPQL